MNLCCVLIQEAKTSPLVPQVTQAWLELAAVACAGQLQNEVAAAWGAYPVGVRVGSGPTDIQPGEVVFAIVEDLPAAPGAIAYHDVNGVDVPTAFLALSTCGTLDDVSQAISHELCEIYGDAACNLWADAGQGKEFAHELCDACERGTYRAANGIAVSDFVLPAFFGPGAAGPYSHLDALPAPFSTAPGGYQIVRDAATGATQVFGDVSARRLAHMRRIGSRAQRRGVRL